jgi:hypothetical protein
MDMKIVEKALQSYVATTADERTDVHEALAEVQLIIANIDESSAYETAGTMIPGSLFSDVINQMLYPLYDKAAHEYSKIVGETSGIDQKTFLKVCHNDIIAREFIDMQLLEGYELINDLWLDNELGRV